MSSEVRFTKYEFAARRVNGKSHHTASRTSVFQKSPHAAEADCLLAKMRLCCRCFGLCCTEMVENIDQMHTHMPLLNPRGDQRAHCRKVLRQPHCRHDHH